MAKLYFPTWVTALDGNRKIVQNPLEYFRETGIEVDEQLQPIKKGELIPAALEAQPQQAKPTGDQHPQTPSLSYDKAAQVRMPEATPAEPPSSLSEQNQFISVRQQPVADTSGIENPGIETRPLTALPTVGDLVKAGMSKTQAKKIVAEEQRKFAAGETPYGPHVINSTSTDDPIAGNELQ